MLFVVLKGNMRRGKPYEGDEKLFHFSSAKPLAVHEYLPDNLRGHELSHKENNITDK